MSTRSHPLHPGTRAWACSCLLAGIVFWGCSVADGEDQPWRYAIGELRSGQQGNVCRSEEDSLEIAKIFETFNPEAGYAALASAPSCSTRVETFTPKRIVKRVTIAEGKPTEYRVSFVEVVTAKGDTRYLVTTREVQE